MVLCYSSSSSECTLPLCTEMVSAKSLPSWPLVPHLQTRLKTRIGVSPKQAHCFLLFTPPDCPHPMQLPSGVAAARPGTSSPNSPPWRLYSEVPSQPTRRDAQASPASSASMPTPGHLRFQSTRLASPRASAPTCPVLPQPVIAPPPYTPAPLKTPDLLSQPALFSCPVPQPHPSYSLS